MQVCCMFAFKVETRQRAQDTQGPGSRATKVLALAMDMN